MSLQPSFHQSNINTQNLPAVVLAKSWDMEAEQLLSFFAFSQFHMNTFHVYSGIIYIGVGSHPGKVHLLLCVGNAVEGLNWTF